MFSRIYVEQTVKQLPRVAKLLAKYSALPQIDIENYAELFNAKQQNFKLQKQNPALIIAQKFGKKLLKTPEGFGVGGTENYYFSHMLNCLYDCRYCFLQGMYNSANYLWFANYEDFFAELRALNQEAQPNSYVFTGYDCDSLALEQITNFFSEYQQIFAECQQLNFELRTKSVALNSLRKTKPLNNLLIAYSLTPDLIAKEIEHGAAPVKSRIKALSELSEAGWQIGLRFDPLIYHRDYQLLYQELFQEIFSKINLKNLHSVSIGPLRFPKKMHEKIFKLYKREALLSNKLEQRDNLVAYSKELEQEMQQFVLKELAAYIAAEKVFYCHNL